MNMTIKVQEFFHASTFTLTYVVFDPQSRDALVIDPALDYDLSTGRVWSESAQQVLNFIEGHKLKLHWILETHAHADHLSAAQVFKEAYPQAQLAISERIREVQKIFGPRFDRPGFRADGSQFDRLFSDGEEFRAGTLTGRVISTPGHTPACTSYLIGENLFTGDAIFMPDSGTGRCDFPGGSAETLFESITQKIYSLPDSVQIFVGHDYQPNERSLEFQTTVGEQKRSNIHIQLDTPRKKYLEFRVARDKVLAAPRLLMPSLQVNIAGGVWEKSVRDGQEFLVSLLKA
jgi:glyoxylase-like metal-dependent hydrolase (beta-lactamase superfamily II)